MTARPASTVLLTAAWGVFALAVAWPTVALLGTTVAHLDIPEGGFTITSRQFGLLWRSTWLAGVTVPLCVLVSLPGAYMVGRVRIVARRPMIAALLAAPLLCPPMVYAFGWERLLPGTFSPHARCVGVWALWAWPIPAMLIGSAWSRVGIGAYEAALLVSSPAVAFVRVVVPLLARHVGLSAVILFTMFFGDYGVPHACGLLVYPTELLGWAASSTRTIDTVWPSIPPVAVTCIALTTVFVAWRLCSTAQEDGRAVQAPHAAARPLVVIALGCFVVSWLPPIAALVFKLDSPAVLADAFTTYGRDLAWSVGVAGTSGLVAVAMGLGVVVTPRAAMIALVWAVVFGAMPGALIGKSLVAAYNHGALGFVYDHWPIVALGYVSRFGWIGIITAMLVTRAWHTDLVAQAQTDGAGVMAILGRIHLPLRWPTLMCAAGIIAALSIAEVPTSSLVRVPGPAPIAHIIIEKFHRFEDGMLISLSLWLVFASLMAVGLLGHALSRWSRE